MDSCVRVRAGDVEIYISYVSGKTIRATKSLSVYFFRGVVACNYCQRKLL